MSTMPGDAADLVGILRQSRHNNALDGVSGVLWFDGRSFLQVFEGPRASVEPTFQRIAADARHHSLRILSDRRIVEHEFGSWDMAYRRNGDVLDPYAAQMRRLMTHASPTIAMQFHAVMTTGAPAPLTQPLHDLSLPLIR